MNPATDPNVPVEQPKQKKKKANKNKKKANEAAQTQLATQTAGLENFAANTATDTANLMSQIQKLFSGLGAPNLERIAEIETQIDQEMNAIQDLLTRVAKEEFATIPDENKESNSSS